MNSNNEMLPEGLGFSMAMNPDAMKTFANMPAEERESVIEESRRVKSKQEMQKIIERLGQK